MNNFNYLRNESKSSSLYDFLIFISFFMSSGDLFWVLNVVGTIRLSLLSFLILIILIGIKKRIALPKVSIFFIIWVLFLSMFIQNGKPLDRAVGYWFFLIVNFLATVSVYNVLKYYSSVKIIRFYLISFFCVAIFGLIQFTFGLFGFKLLLSQYWSLGLPRVNGFSYEPSYFITYMLSGWIILYILRMEVYGNIFFKRRIINFIFFVVSISMLLSFSRMGILCMLSFLICYHFKETYSQLRLKKISRKNIALFASILGIAISGSVYAIHNAKSVLNGIDFNNLQQSHSSGPRISAFLEEWKAFQDSPLIGYGIGGIPSARAYALGTKITTMEESQALEGSVVFLEVLLASGIFGFILFMILILYPICKISRYQKNISNNTRAVLKSFKYGYIFTLIILQFNQNINRVYFWSLFGFILALSSRGLVRKMEKVIG